MAQSIPEQLAEIERLIHEFPTVDTHHCMVLNRVETKIAAARALYESYQRRVEQTHSMCRELSGQHLSVDSTSHDDRCVECHEPLTATPPINVVHRWLTQFAPQSAAALKPVKTVVEPLPICQSENCQRLAHGTCFHCNLRVCATHGTTWVAAGGGVFMTCPTHAAAIRQDNTVVPLLTTVAEA